MDSKPAPIKASVVLAAIAVALAASLLCGAQPAWAVEEVQYVEKSWDAESKQVVSETKTAQAAALTSDTEYINGWCYVSGTIEGSKRLTVMEGQEANIILTDGSKLTLEKGINVHWASKLNIYAQQGETGELVCYADTNKENAPIGSDNNSGPNGSITIHGGKITANNDNDEAHAAGIGAGKTGAGGTITIYDGTIEARGGNGSAGIGGGDAYGSGRDGGTITIYGGDVKAYGGGGAAGIGGGRGGNGGTITIWGGKVYAKGGPKSSYGFYDNSGAGIGSGDDDKDSTATTGGTISIYGGEVEAYGGPDAAGIGGGDGCIGGYITITGGTVKATGGNYASGIGAGDDTDGRVNASIINITGGTIEATGGKYGAGIGGGEGGGGGIINISGGAVTASAGSGGAGIGGGYGGNGDNVTISGGTVVATGNAGGAGIGGGDGGAGTNIIISGGIVEAIGGANGSGIGNGEGGTGMATTVTLKYAEDEYDISVKATSYRCNNEDTSVTLTMENPFMDKGTREAFAATSYTAGNLDTLNNKTLVRASTFGVTVSEAQGGSVVVGKSRAVPGSTVTLTVAPDAGGWELKPGTLKAKAGETELALTQDTSDSSKYTFTMPAADVTVAAEFMQKLAVESVSLNKEETTLVVDGTETLVATVLPEATDTTVVDTTVTWKSSDESVATVDGTGKVTAVAPGEATITATATNGTDAADDDKTATCAVTVSKAEVTAPAIASKVYNGKLQTADIEASDLYDVTENNGDTDAGEYDVVLTLKNPSKYKWTDSDEAAKTLKFKITKGAAPEVAVPELEAVTYDPDATLADVALPRGWAWTDGTAVPAVGNDGYEASITVDDANYDYAGVEGYDEAAHKVTRTVSLAVNKAEVAAPKIESKPYNGRNQTADVPGSALYAVTSNEGGTEVGTYSVVLELTEPANYAWEGAEGATVTLDFVIRECGHDWGEVEYAWADGNGEVTATRVCGACGEVETETVPATLTTVNPTATEPGARTWTSGAFENPAFEAQTKTEVIEPLGPLQVVNGRQQTWVASERREISASAQTLALGDGEVVTKWLWEYTRTPGDEASWTRSGAATYADGGTCSLVIPECTAARKAPMSWRATAKTSFGRTATSEPQTLADLQQLVVSPDPEGDFAWVLGKDVELSAKVAGLAPGEEIESYAWYYSANGKTFKRSGAKAAQPAADILTLSGFKCTEARKAPMAWTVRITTTDGRTATSEPMSLAG